MHVLILSVGGKDCQCAMQSSIGHLPCEDLRGVLRSHQTIGITQLADHIPHATDDVFQDFHANRQLQSPINHDIAGGISEVVIAASVEGDRRQAE